MRIALINKNTNLVENVIELDLKKEFFKIPIDYITIPTDIGNIGDQYDNLSKIFIKQEKFNVQPIKTTEDKIDDIILNQDKIQDKLKTIISHFRIR